MRREGGQRSGRRRAVAAAGASVVALAVLGITVANYANLGSESPAPTTAAPTASGSAGPLSDEARELLSILDKDRKATFHARYEATSPDVPDATIQIEEWRKPPRSRQDSALDSSGRQVLSSVIVVPDATYRCAKAGDEPWRCAKSDEKPGDLLTNIRNQLAGANVTARDDVVEGRQVRCFTLERQETSSEMCATSEGIPVTVSSGGGTLRLVELSRDVDDDVFTPPAPA